MSLPNVGCLWQSEVKGSQFRGPYKVGRCSWYKRANRACGKNQREVNSISMLAVWAFPEDGSARTCKLCRLETSLVVCEAEHSFKK